MSAWVSERTAASKMNLTIEKPNLGRFLKVTLRAPHSHRGKHREVLGEELFRRILCWERKRAERSRSSFLLMLIDTGTVLRANRKERVLTRILSALSCSTRETDVAGWYRESAILGVIFTEVREAERNALQSLVLAKLSEALRASLGAEDVDQIRISFHFFPEDWDKPNTSRLSDEKLYPDLFERNEARKYRHVVKRAMDIVGSIIALILFSPLFVVIALAIKLTSKGRILFKQERVGQYGLRFTFLKFRSMECVNDPGIHQKYVKRFIAGEVDLAQSGPGQNVVYKIQQDPRVTRVGKFLRKTSLDELPQLINVLKGEMSLVGPRPPIPYESEVYEAWHWRRVLEAKPGITGLWQVNGRSRLKFNDMVRLDLQYAKTWSLWLDIKILLRTPRAVLFGEGAY
jgi:exopolysaccharide biosynthesis polyprenyl glycosylphosphotransferase